MTNKSARIYLNILGNSVIQSLKRGKRRKSGLAPMSRQENVRIYFWCSLPYLKHDKKPFIRIPSLNVAEMRPLGTFSQFFQTVTMERMTVRNISTSVLAMDFQVLSVCKLSLPSSGRRKSYQ